MTGRKNPHSHVKPQLSQHWLLFALIVGILVFSSLSFIQPSSQKNQNLTPSPIALTCVDDTLTPAAAITSTAEVEESPPTPEEIGTTDGIIFFSTILVLILLLGTLRETIRRKGR